MLEGVEDSVILGKFEPGFEVSYEKHGFRRYQSGQPTVFRGTYIITVLQCVYTWLILQLCAFWPDWYLRKLGSAHKTLGPALSCIELPRPYGTRLTLAHGTAVQQELRHIHA